MAGQPQAMLVIPTPALGILDLSRGRDAALATDDRALLEPLFDRISQSADNVPACDVLFVYCVLNDDGSIAGSDFRLPKILSKSGAMIAVVASENSSTAYEAAIKDGVGQMVISENLVLTLNRRGNAFGDFFRQLFTLMREGKSMPVAWVRIAPQHSGKNQPENPDTIFIAAAGQVRFEKRAQYDNGPSSASSLRLLLARLTGK